MKVAFYTLGCKVNQYETNSMIRQFENNGYTIVSFDEVSDIYIINTCTVTNMSDRKSRQMIQKAKKNNENSIIVAVGCLAQVGKEDLAKIAEIDLILGNEEKKNIVQYVEKYLQDRNENMFVEDIMKQGEYSKDYMATTYENTRAVVKVQDGCNNYCTYCIIPYARGKVRSKPLEEVIEEVKNIANNGYKEIVITGIHICSYGRDLEDVKFIDLLEKLNEIEGIDRIRLGSLEPKEITNVFLDRLIKLKKVCPHFHLSLQSGCTETLKRMNRKYTTEDIKEVVDNIRKRYENANITTDIIVGFPGETEDEFNKTVEFLKMLKLNKMHIFQYSRRKGTVADKMENQISPEIKKERSNILLGLSDLNEKNYLSEYIGKEVEVLIEKCENDVSYGYTNNYIYTRIEQEFAVNTIANFKVIKIEKNIMFCE